MDNFIQIGFPLYLYLINDHLQVYNMYCYTNIIMNVLWLYLNRVVVEMYILHQIFFILAFLTDTSNYEIATFMLSCFIVSTFLFHSLWGYNNEMVERNKLLYLVFGTFLLAYSLVPALKGEYYGTILHSMAIVLKVRNAKTKYITFFEVSHLIYLNLYFESCLTYNL